MGRPVASSRLVRGKVGPTRSVIAFFKQFPASFELRAAVHREESDRRPADRGAADNLPLAVDQEMRLPRVVARVEEVSSQLRRGVDARKISSLMEVALRATPAEIVEFISASVNSGDDVVDVKRPLIRRVGEPAILASSCSAIANEFPRPLIHAS